MSQSSETVTTSDFDLLNYPDQGYGNGYYTAQARPGIGVCIAAMSGGTMVQFFPWGRVSADEARIVGHHLYAKFITEKATAALAEVGELFTKWPFMHTESNELLIIKCLVEDGLNQVEQWNANQRGQAGPKAGEAVE